jgi:hypothetical protein
MFPGTQHSVKVRVCIQASAAQHMWGVVQMTPWSLQTLTQHRWSTIYVCASPQELTPVASRSESPPQCPSLVSMTQSHPPWLQTAHPHGQQPKQVRQQRNSNRVHSDLYLCQVTERPRHKCSSWAQHWVSAALQSVAVRTTCWSTLTCLFPRLACTSRGGGSIPLQHSPSSSLIAFLGVRAASLSHFP